MLDYFTLDGVKYGLWRIAASLIKNFSVSSSVSNDNSHFGRKNGATVHSAVK